MPFAGLAVLVVASAITAGWHQYLFRRLIRDSTGDARSRRVGKYLLAGLWGWVTVGPGLFFYARSRATEWAATFAWTWLGLSAFLTTLLLTADALWLVGRSLRKQEVNPQRRQLLSRAVAGSAVVATGAFGARGLYRAYSPPEITELSLRLPNLPPALDGFTLVQLSDLHVGPLIGGKLLDDWVERCNGLKPDLVAITGDLVDGTVKMLGSTVARLGQLRSRFGTYFVTGNHDYYSGDDSWCEALRQMGISVLRNRRTVVGDPNASFDLMGVDDWRGSGPRKRYDLTSAIRGRDPSRASILLAHQPKNFDQVAAEGIGLQLSGHTHGGQLFPMTLGIRLLWERAVGLYRVGTSHIYVHRGTGFWGPPMRVGSAPEIAKITLVSR